VHSVQARPDEGHVAEPPAAAEACRRDRRLIMLRHRTRVVKQRAAARAG
jgi:hypothetical protein